MTTFFIKYLVLSWAACYATKLLILFDIQLELMLIIRENDNGYCFSRRRWHHIFSVALSTWCLYKSVLFCSLFFFLFFNFLIFYYAVVILLDRLSSVPFIELGTLVYYDECITFLSC
jgi:hypothetical protein